MGFDRDVASEHDETRLDRPDMEVMDIADAWNRFDSCCDVGDPDTRRS